MHAGGMSCNAAVGPCRIPCCPLAAALAAAPSTATGDDPSPQPGRPPESSLLAHMARVQVLIFASNPWPGPGPSHQLRLKQTRPVLPYR